MNLQNNSSEMKTVVETFVIEETAELIYDNEKLDKWNDLVNTLELKGQKKIVKPDKSPVPFMHLKQSLINVFETLCPRKINVEEYSITPIPVEILDLVALSKRENYFNNIQIWYDDKKPDPICVGEIKRFGEWNNYNWNIAEEASKALGKEIASYSYETTKYLLGKWADVKHSFEQLTEMAKKRYISQQGAQYQKTIKETQRKIDDLELQAVEMFEGGESLPF